MPIYPIDGYAYEKTYPTSIPLAANNGASRFELDTDCLLETLQFQLTGTLTNAGYTTEPVKRVEAVENLIRNLQIKGSSKFTGMPSDTFTDVDASYLAYQTKMLETTAPFRKDVGTANASYDFASTFNRYFGLKRHRGNYTDGFLETRNFSTFNVTANWRGVEAMIQPGTGVAGASVLSNVGITVHSIQFRGGRQLARKVYLKQSQRSFDLTNMSGLNVRFKDAPVLARMPKQTFKTTVGDTDYADPSDAVFTTNLQAQGAFLRTVQNGNFPWLEISATALRAKMKTDYSVESLPVGYLTQEYSRFQTVVGDLDLRQARSLENVVDLTTVGGSVNTLQITDEQVIGG